MSLVAGASEEGPVGPRRSEYKKKIHPNMKRVTKVKPMKLHVANNNIFSYVLNKL